MIIKRIFDIIFSLAGLILLLPVFILVTLIIKITMPGPVFFRQTRIGYNAQPFTIYKLRSMRVNTSNVSITLSNDERITPFGRFLRQTKVDELPQLFNIIKGDMSVVGPRPDVPGYSDKLSGEDQLIWTVKPGLTGLDSLTYPDEQIILDKQEDPQQYYDEVLWPAKVAINVEYVKNHTMMLDFKIIFRTIFRKWENP